VGRSGRDENRRTLHGSRGDAHVATELGSFAFFVAAWVPMMAAMMLPGAVPGVLKSTGPHRHLHAVLLFVGSYLAVWAVVGLSVYALYRPHGAALAGALTIAAGLYELTPPKREWRRRCRGRLGSGRELGRYCDVPLALAIVALGIVVAFAPSSVPGLTPAM
jgi:predicted metal-binding membrane protein